MNIYQLRYFAALAHTEHYTKAAQQLHITQPNLSHAIRSLEEELGVSLFEKKGRNVVLTKYGREFLGDAQRILQMTEDSIKKMQALQDGKECISLGFVRSLGIDLMPRILYQFRKKMDEKEISFRFYEEATHPLINRLKKWECDLVFCNYVDKEPEVSFIPIYHQDYYVIVAEDHPLASLEEVDLCDTVQYPYIFFREDAAMRQRVNQIFHRAGTWPQQVIVEFFEDEVIAGFVAAGFGIAIVEDMKVLDTLPLKKLKIKGGIGQHKFYMAYLKQREYSPAVRRFTDFVCRETEKNP